MPEGLLFVATGATYVAEAVENARASRAHAGERPIALMTDDVETARRSGVFDLVLPHPDARGSYRDKIPALLDPPFDRTLYLDSDARLIARVDDLFRLLASHDVAAAHAPVRIPAGWSDPAVPASWPELNSGVLLLGRGRMQERLIRDWLDRYDEVGQGWDQATLRSSTWHLLSEGLRVGLLPPEANLRTTKPWVAGKGSPVFVVHGRVPETEWAPLIRYLNDDIDRFRTDEGWRRAHPSTSITPKVAPSRRSSGATVPGSTDFATVDGRFPAASTDPLACEDPVFVLAAGWCSGSDRLRRMLCSDPRMVVWSEPFDRSGVIQTLVDQWRPFGTDWPDAPSRAPLETADPKDEHLMANRSPEVQHLRAAHRNALDRLLGEPGRRAGRERWGLEEVRLGGAEIDCLSWLLPGARFLLLLRNPFDAYARYKRQAPGHHRWPEPPIRGAAAFGRLWSRLAGDFIERSGAERCLLVRHEDLETAVPSIRAHTGLSDVATPDQLVCEDAARLTPLERHRLGAATRELRRELGYPSP